MKSLKNKFFVGLAATCLVAGASAFAQTSSPAPAAQTMPMEKGKSMEKMQHKMQQRMQTSMEKHRAQLHEKLKLTAQQEPAWKTFTEATQPHDHAAMQDKQAEHKAMMNMSTPARMEKMLEHAKERTARMQQHLDALKTFYAVLTPEQQKIFDDNHARMQGAMKMRMQHRMQDRMQHRKHEHMPEGGQAPMPAVKKS